MKRSIIILILLLFTNNLYAASYPASEADIKKYLGENYLTLRKTVPVDDAGYFSTVEVLPIEKEKTIGILSRLLNDKNITKVKGVSLFESININSPDTFFNEGMFVLGALIEMLLDGSGYKNRAQALADEYKKLDEGNRKLIISTMDKRIKFYSILYQKDSNMSKECADTLAINVFRVNSSSRELNKKAIKSFKGLIDKGCLTIGILARYADALLNEGEFAKSQNTAKKLVVDLYNKYFDQLSDQNLNYPTTITFLWKISLIKEEEKDYDSEFKIYKKISKYILLDKIKLEDQPPWMRERYLKLLSRTLRLKKLKKYQKDNEVIENLRKVLKKKGNIFKEVADYKSIQLKDEEKEFLRQIQQVD